MNWLLRAGVGIGAGFWFFFGMKLSTGQGVGVPGSMVAIGTWIVFFALLDLYALLRRP